VKIQSTEATKITPLATLVAYDELDKAFAEVKKMNLCAIVVVHICFFIV